MFSLSYLSYFIIPYKVSRSTVRTDGLQEAGLDEESIARRKAAQKAHEDSILGSIWSWAANVCLQDEWHRRLKEATGTAVGLKNVSSLNPGPGQAG